MNLNFTVAFLLTSKTWDDQFAGKVGGGWVISINWEGILVMGNDSEKRGGGGGDTLLRTMAPEKMQHSRKGPVKVELKEH